MQTTHCVLKRTICDKPIHGELSETHFMFISLFFVLLLFIYSEIFILYDTIQISDK